MKRFYKIPNELFKFKLSSSAFYIYIHLSNRFYWKKSIRIKLKTIAASCSMSINTVRSALTELISFDMIRKIHHKHIRSGYVIANEYVIRRLSGSFSMIDERAFYFLKEDKSAAYIYCAAAMCKNHSGFSFPSYNQLSGLTGLSRSTCISKVNKLNSLGVICRERYVLLQGSFGHNNYAQYSMELRICLFIVILKRYGRYEVLFEPLEYTFTVMPGGNFNIHHTDITISLLFSVRGSINFDKPILDPHKLRLILEKKGYIFLFKHKKSNIFSDFF